MKWHALKEQTKKGKSRQMFDLSVMDIQRVKKNQIKRYQ